MEQEEKQVSGFLDSKERVLDLVMTDVGKSLLLKGDLRFRYWIPFDDEVDYNPQAEPRAGQTQEERILELVESPLSREATLGYRGLSFAEEDTTNVHNPMFTAPPGVGHSYGLPRASIGTGSLTVSLQQKKISQLYQQRDSSGNEIVKSVQTDVGFQRSGSNSQLVEASFPDGAFPDGTKLDGFLMTVYLSSTLKLDELGQAVGGYEEILHTRDSSGSIAFRNDIKIENFTP